MEYLIIFTLCAGFVAASAILFFLLSTKKLITTASSSSNKPRIKLPPGPRKLPIIGNLHQLYGHLPQHILYDLAKKHGPLMHLQFGEVSTIVVSSPEITKEIFKTHDTNFSHRPTNFLFSKALSYHFSDMMYEPYGTFWREMRKLVAMKLLCTKRVQSFRGIREEEVMNLMRSIFLLKGSCINLSKVISSLLSTITGRAAFGNKNQEDLEKYILLLDQLFSLGSGFQISDMYPSIKFLQIITGTKRMLESVSEEMYKIVENIWREHKEKKFAIDDDMMEDFVDDLLNIQNAAGDLGVPFTDKNLKAIIFVSTPPSHIYFLFFFRLPLSLPRCSQQSHEYLLMLGRLEGILATGRNQNDSSRRGFLNLILNIEEPILHIFHLALEKGYALEFLLLNLICCYHWHNFYFILIGNFLHRSEPSSLFETP